MTGIRCTPDMFKGANAASMLEIFKGYCAEGVILSDVEMVRNPDMLDNYVLIIGYARAGTSVVTQQGDPTRRGPEHDRVFEMPRKELRIPVKGAYLDTELVISKLSMLRDRNG